MGWFVDFQEFSQADRSGRVERSELVQWAANGDMVSFCELSGQSKQCFEFTVVCFVENDDSQTGQNCSSQGIKQDRNKSSGGICGQSSKLAEHTSRI